MYQSFGVVALVLAAFVCTVSTEPPEMQVLPTLATETTTTASEEIHIEVKSAVSSATDEAASTLETTEDTTSEDGTVESKSLTDEVLPSKEEEEESSNSKAEVHDTLHWGRSFTSIVEYLYYGPRPYVTQSEGSEARESLEEVQRKAIEKAANKSFTKVNCSIREQNESLPFFNTVTIVNDSSLLQLLMNETVSVPANQSSPLPAAECQTLMLFAPWCPFSAKLAAHYNALSRLFPDLRVLAINAVMLNYWNARFGTVAVPNVLLLHNGKFVARYNYTEKNIEGLTWFIQNLTNLNASGEVGLVEEDYLGPVPTQQVLTTDVYLILSWAVIIFALGYGCHHFKQPVMAFYFRLRNLFDYEHIHID